MVRLSMWVVIIQHCGILIWIQFTKVLLISIIFVGSPFWWQVKGLSVGHLKILYTYRTYCFFCPMFDFELYNYNRVWLKRTYEWNALSDKNKYLLDPISYWQILSPTQNSADDSRNQTNYHWIYGKVLLIVGCRTVVVKQWISKYISAYICFQQNPFLFLKV